MASWTNLGLNIISAIYCLTSLSLSFPIFGMDLIGLAHGVVIRILNKRKLSTVPVA